MRIRFHPCDLPYLCISDWHMSTPYHHHHLQKRRLFASVLLEVRTGFNLSLNSRGSFSYQHTVQPPEHGRLEMINMDDVSRTTCQTFLSVQMEMEK